MFWSDDELVPFLRNRADAIGAPERLSEDDMRLQLTDQWETLIYGIHGCVRNATEWNVFSVTDPVSRAVFMHAVDEIIIAAELATPEALSTTAVPNERIPLPPDTASDRLANHLWRAETEFDYHPGLYEELGSTLWRPMHTEAAFCAAALAIGLFRVDGPISSTTAFREAAVPATTILSPDGPPDVVTRLFSLAGASGTSRIVAKVTDWKVADFWAADDTPENIADSLSALEDYFN